MLHFINILESYIFRTLEVWIYLLVIRKSENTVNCQQKISTIVMFLASKR